MTITTADQLTPGDVIKTALGPYRIDFLRNAFGGVEVHNRTIRSRVLWFYPRQTVETVGREEIVPPLKPAFATSDAPEAG